VQSRRDQAQAYGFVTRRLSAAVIGADPDGTDQPMRRLGRAAFLGVMVAVLAVAGVTVYGYVRPGHDTDWQRGGVLIVERDTSTRYLYSDGVLHPVLNYASASSPCYGKAIGCRSAPRWCAPRSDTTRWPRYRSTRRCCR
jgi:hypothetical protein